MNLYVIGPVTGKPKENIREFNHAASMLKEAKHKVAIPHDFIESGVTWNKAMQRSIERMMSRWGIHGNGFGIALLDGWEDSKGARIEHDLAEALGIECRPWREWL